MNKFLRRLVYVSTRLLLLFALLLGLSWVGAGVALDRLDQHLEEHQGTSSMPEIELSSILRGSLFVAAQIFRLRQPGGDFSKAGNAFQDCPACPEMIPIAGGYYLMGSPLTELERFDHVFLPRPLRRRVGHSMREGPRRLVWIQGPIAYSRYEVTLAHWRDAQAHPSWEDITGLAPRIPELGEEYEETRPITGIDWTDATAYARFLSHLTGHAYRLPTEAEWEYAARGNSAGRYPWGEEIGMNNAACAGCSDIWTESRIGPIGLHPPNELGLYDMHGNAFEWTQDCFFPWNSSVRANGSAVEFPDCQFRTVRGGNAEDDSAKARSAFRVGPHYYNKGEGFSIRLVRDM